MNVYTSYGPDISLLSIDPTKHGHVGTRIHV